MPISATALFIIVRRLIPVPVEGDNEAREARRRIIRPMIPDLLPG